MPKKVFFALPIALAAIFSGVASAAGITSWQNALQGPPVEQPAAQTPDPARLTANWWDYLQAEGPTLDERITATSILLGDLLEKLPADTAQAARPLVDRIELQMDALAQARSLSMPPPSKPTPPADSYKIPEVLDIVERLRREQQQLKEQQVEVNVSEKAMTGANRGVDTQMAAYLVTSPDDPKRVLLGLEIMLDRIAIGVAREQLRIAKAELANQESVVDQLLGEEEAAVDQLMAQPEYLETLDADIEQARVNLQQVRQRLVNQQTTALSVVPTAESEKSTTFYLQQQITGTEVEQAIAEARLIRLQMQRQLAQLLVNAEALSPKPVREQFAEWNEQLAAVRMGIAGWTDDSRAERERADAALAAAYRDEGGVEPLTRVVIRDRLDMARETLLALERLEIVLAQTDLLNAMVHQELTERIGGFSDWRARAMLGLEDFWETLVRWGSQSLFKVKDTPVTAFGLLRVAVIIFVAWLVSYWWRRVLQRVGAHRAGSVHAVYTIGRLTQYVLIGVGLTIGLSSIGIDFTNLAVMAGAIGIGIGFGLQSIVKNFLSGIILLFERTLKVGDFVEMASGVTGEVRAINVRSTVINTNDNLDVVVPNSQFIEHEVTNWTLLETDRRIHVPFRVAYEVDTDLVHKAVLEAAESVPHTLKTKKPGVWLVDFGDSGLECELVVWLTPAAVKRPGAVDAAYKWAIEAALRKYGFKVPLPQRDLHLRSGFETQAPAGGRIPLEEIRSLLKNAPGRS